MVLNTKYGTAKISKYGYWRITSKKEGNCLKFLHRLIFEDFYNIDLNEEFPEGVIIHHEDGNKLNNEIWNLVPMTPSEHMALHRTDNFLSNSTLKLMSKLRNSTGFFRVGTAKDKTKQGFIWIYQYYNERKKRRKISSVNLVSLKEKVISQGLEWEIIDRDNAIATCNKYGYDINDFMDTENSDGDLE